MSTLTVKHGAWSSFIEDPVSYIHPERLQACFEGKISIDLAARMKAVSRIRKRLDQIVRGYYGLASKLPDADCDDYDMAVALAPADVLLQIVPRAGAIYWSGAIANTVLATEVDMLQTKIGENLCELAVKNRDLSGPHNVLPPLDAISEQIMESGWRCLAAWRQTLAPFIETRVRLKLPPSEPFDSAPLLEFKQMGPAIIRRVAA